MNRLNFFEQEKVYSIILCGGSGTRLWPLSRKSYPKQFLTLGGSNKSLLQACIERVKNISPISQRWVITAEGQQSLTQQQVQDNISRVLVEPLARNTAPAIALAAWQLMQEDPESIMVILSSDHSIQNVRSFEQTISDAVSLAKHNYFVTVGIHPTYPATGFGYIEQGNAIDDHGKVIYPTKNQESFASNTKGYSVRSFREKPSQAAAEQFLRTGKYLWNAGIFVWKTKTFWQSFNEIQPKIASLISSIDESNIKEKYALLDNIPIDIAFIEQTSNVACVPAMFDWNDVGSWSAVRECFVQDSEGNSVSGDVFLYETKNSVVHSSDRFVATIGLENIAVIATKDSVLVMPLSRSQDVKKIITHLENEKRTHLL
ncbi:MAG: hypothetical protein K2X39_09175 [Silvanigrellaceae bacterium]|nr:hypothetical protein [Silvanigrellaceae bacterium]